MEETTTLRFKVGDRVACNVGATFQTGTVIKLWYTEKYYPEGANRLQSLVPYQVRLDNDNTIYAPKDEDDILRYQAVLIFVATVLRRRVVTII